MKHTLTTAFVLYLLMLSCSAVAQEPVYKYWVQLTDKAGTPYSLERPQEYLSTRALERRQRQRIAIDSLDLPVSPVYVQSLQQTGLTVMHRCKWLNGVVAYSTDSLPSTWADNLPFVASYTLCDIGSLTPPMEDEKGTGDYHSAQSSSPSEDIILTQTFDEEDTLSAYYGGGYLQIAQLNGIGLHCSGYQGQGILIGLCDAGYDGADTLAVFEAMRNEGRLLAFRDFVWPTANVYNSHAHGTHVLSTLASYVPGFYVGTAPQASYVLCRTENPLSETLLEEYNWVVAAEYLDSIGVDIISSSLGYFQFDDSTQNHSLDDLDGQTTTISRGAALAVSRGVLVVISAGNDGQAIIQHLSVPADVPQVLTVGAVDTRGERAEFSSYGPTATLCIKPDVMALGKQVITVGEEGSFRLANGTSLSCPIMAGMMACLWQQRGDYTPQQLCDSVRSWGSLSAFPDRYSGYGIPDFSRALQGYPVGISDVVEDLPSPQLSVYPNPSRGPITIEVSTPDGGTVALYNMLGQLVWQTSLPSAASGPHTVSCNLPLSAGIYWVTLRPGLSARLLIKP